MTQTFVKPTPSPTRDVSSLQTSPSIALHCPFCRTLIELPQQDQSDSLPVVSCQHCEANVVVTSEHHTSVAQYRSLESGQRRSDPASYSWKSGFAVSAAFCLLNYFLLMLLAAWGFEEAKQRYDPYDIDEHLYSGYILEAQGWTGLHLAAARGDADAVRHLVATGSQIEARNQRGRTALYEASKRGQLATMTVLIDHGANLEAKGKYGYSPIFPAIQRGHLEAVDLLVTRGAQINARCDCGATTLYEAVKWGQEDVASFLVEHGASINAKVNGQTALAYAEEHEMDNMADLLRQFGAKTFKDSEQLVEQGAVFFKQEQWDQAISSYTKALSLDPESLPAYSHRAAAWIKKNDFDRALDDYQRILQLAPTHLDTHMNISWIYAQRKQWDRGVQLWSNLIRLQPNNAKAYYERAHHTWEQKDIRSAKEDLHRACSIGYQDGCAMWQSLGASSAS